jgi:hypothetical protein
MRPTKRMLTAEESRDIEGRRTRDARVRARGVEGERVRLVANEEAV